MNAEQLHVTINRVIKKEGILRVPAFWMNYILSRIAKELDIRINTSIPVTYYELLSMRDMGKLVPGQKYIITDYHTTTSQAFSKSANHRFNIIVEALDEYALNEEAYASKIIGDEYFTKTNMSAWKLWYCIDNDKSRFEWADENGTGVIYRMIDEYGNDCPYDFKNIQFLRSKNWQDIHQDWFDVDGKDKFEDIYLYTFTGREKNMRTGRYDEFIDGSLKAPYKYRQTSAITSSSYHNNIIHPCMNLEDEKGIMTLPDNVFIGYADKRGTGKDIFENIYTVHYSFGNDIKGKHNTFLMECNGNVVEGDYNLLGNRFRNNKINGGFNKFYQNCSGNITGDHYNDNKHGKDFQNNTIGEFCESNIFGEFINSNQFGNNFIGNSVGNECQYNSFKTDTVNNQISDKVYDNVFGSYFMNNIVLPGISENTFGGFCKHNTINGNGIKFEGYNEYIDINCNFCNIKMGLKGEENNNIIVDVENRDFIVEVGRDSMGNVKLYNEIDLIN